MIYIVDIEAVETRYTAQWKQHLPKMFGDKCVNISGGDVPQTTTPGAFLAKFKLLCISETTLSCDKS